MMLLQREFVMQLIKSALSLFLGRNIINSLWHRGASVMAASLPLGTVPHRAQEAVYQTRPKSEMEEDEEAPKDGGKAARNKEHSSNRPQTSHYLIIAGVSNYTLLYGNRAQNLRKLRLCVSNL
jgi:hypothetical protein